jgi:hypothetical protein
MPPISIELAFLAGRALFLILGFVLAAIVFMRWRRATERSAARFEQANATLLERLTALDARMEAAQLAFNELNGRVAELTRSTTATTTSPSYQIAIRMARGGAAHDELMASCGLTRQEAELVQRLHAPAPRPRTAAAA